MNFQPHDEAIYNKLLACELNIPLMDKNASNMSNVDIMSFMDKLFCFEIAA